MDKVTTLTEQLQHWIFTFGPKLVSAILVFIIGLIIINWAARLAAKSMKKRNVDSSLQTFFSSMVSVGLKVLLLITVAGMLGIQTTSFVAIIGALGLAVGLALQGSLANFAGGVLILVFKPFKAGDLIESGGQTGGKRARKPSHRVGACRSDDWRRFASATAADRPATVDHDAAGGHAGPAQAPGNRNGAGRPRTGADAVAQHAEGSELGRDLESLPGGSGSRA